MRIFINIQFFLMMAEMRNNQHQVTVLHVEGVFDIPIKLINRFQTHMLIRQSMKRSFLCSLTSYLNLIIIVYYDNCNETKENKFNLYSQKKFMKNIGAIEQLQGDVPLKVVQFATKIIATNAMKS